MYTYDATPPAARDLTAAASNTAPTARDLTAAGTAAAPVGIALGAGHDNTEPDPVDRAQELTSAAPCTVNLAAALVADAPAARPLSAYTVADDAPATASVGDYTPSHTAAVPITAAPVSSLINMPASFTPAFVEVTGGGNCLDSLSASTADIGKILQGTVAGELRSYQVRAGTDATALPGLVRPANFEPTTNAIVFVQL